MAPCDAQAEIRRLSEQVRILTNERNIAAPLAGQLGKELHAALERIDRLTSAHSDTARLDKLPQCFHMLRYRNGLWHLTYETGKQYAGIREAIDAHHIWDAGAFGAECAAANQVFGPGGTFGGSTDGGAP